MSNIPHARRCPMHDYRRPATYMITISRGEGVPALSFLKGDIDWNPRNPIPGKTRPYTVATRHGRCIVDAMKLWKEQNSGLFDVYVWTLMPDHLHIMLRVKVMLSEHLGSLIGRFKSASTLLFHRNFPDLNIRPCPIKNVNAGAVSF